MDGTFNMANTHREEDSKLPRIVSRWQPLRKSIKSKLCFQYTVPSEPTYRLQTSWQTSFRFIFSVCFDIPRIVRQVSIEPTHNRVLKESRYVTHSEKYRATAVIDSIT